MSQGFSLALRWPHVGDAVLFHRRKSGSDHEGTKMTKPILCLDFDGGSTATPAVGWKGARIILDPPVPGALDFILRSVRLIFTVAILSSRSHQWGGLRDEAVA